SQIMSDHRFAEALAAAQAGRADGLGPLLEGERDPLKCDAQRLIPWYLAGAVEASDLVQETFLRAKKYLGTFQGQTRREWRAWLRAILRNRVRTHRQAAARKRAIATSMDQNGHTSRAHPTDPHQTPRTALVTKEQAERMLGAL